MEIESAVHHQLVLLFLERPVSLWDAVSLRAPVRM